MKEFSDIPGLVKKAVLEIDSKAEVYLFGSRARNDFSEESDWDFLVLTEAGMDPLKVNNLRKKILDIELNKSQTICLVTRTKSRWHELEVTPLYQNIRTEGILI